MRAEKPNRTVFVTNRKRSQKCNKGKTQGVMRKRDSALEYAARFYEACDTPRSLMLYLMIKHQEYAQLVSVSFNWSDYSEPRAGFIDYQCTKLLAKCIDIPTGINTKAVATRAFLTSERECSETNETFRQLWSGDFQFPRDVSSVLYLAQLKIADILGDVPSLDALSFNYGPGSSFSVRGDTSIYKKLSSALECTYAFSPILQEFLEEFPAYVPEGTINVNIVEGSELTYVPKNAKTDRPICIEPLLNGLYQKGIGDYLKRRLLLAGIDLRDQGINQTLANNAVSNKLATVDFSSASDTISYNVVLDLLPFEWFKLLDYGRSQRYTVEDRWYDFQKFSSMGNAYTFELESMIFYSLAWAACKHAGIVVETQKNISVFGDDVIIPEQAYGLFSKAANAIGFTINHEKSFVKGLFRESCGSDSYDGYIVTPFKIETLKEDKDVYKTANQLLKIIERIIKLPSTRSDTIKCATRLWRLHGWLISTVPRSYRLLVPADAGDVGFHAPFDVACPTRARDKDGWYYKGLKWRSTKGSFVEGPPGIATWGRTSGLRNSDSLVREPAHYLRLTTWRNEVLRKKLEFGPECKITLDPRVVDSDDPIIPSIGKTEYTIRKRGQFVVRRRFVFGQWVDPWIPWADCALALVASPRRRG